MGSTRTLSDQLPSIKPFLGSTYSFECTDDIMRILDALSAESPDAELKTEFFGYIDYLSCYRIVAYVMRADPLRKQTILLAAYIDLLYQAILIGF